MYYLIYFSVSEAEVAPRVYLLVIFGPAMWAFNASCIVGKECFFHSPKALAV